MLFTAMTRAKAWLTLSGTGPNFEYFLRELEQARSNFPKLDFEYPSGEALSIMRRDLKDAKENNLSAEAILASAGALSEGEKEKLLRMLQDGSGKRKQPSKKSKI